MKIASDKWKHIYVGTFLGLLFQGIFWWLMPAHPVLGSLINLFLVIAISYGFELFSLITSIGIYELMDAIASTAGGLLGLLLVLMFQMQIF
jgi:glycopeptide antibiotics resistance protein